LEEGGDDIGTSHVNFGKLVNENAIKPKIAFARKTLWQKSISTTSPDNQWVLQKKLV
jgi:hypothetical protein